LRRISWLPAVGQQKCERSNRFANRHRPEPSHQTILIRSALLARKTYKDPSNGSAPASRTKETSPSGPLRKSTAAARNSTRAPGGIMPHAPRAEDDEGRPPQ